MWSPKLKAHIPKGKMLRNKLNYGPDNRSHGEGLSFIEDLRRFRREFRDSNGVLGKTFYEWNSSDHQRGLDEMTDAYLELERGGPKWWPDDPSQPYYSSLQYSKDRIFIRQQVRHLLWRLNDAGYRNEKHKAMARKAKQDDIVVSDIPRTTHKKSEKGHQGPSTSTSTSTGGPPDRQGSYAPQSFSVGSSISSSIDLERENATELEEKTRGTTCEKSLPGQTRVHQQSPSSTRDQHANSSNSANHPKRQAEDRLDRDHGAKKHRTDFVQPSPHKSPSSDRARSLRDSTKYHQRQYTTPEAYAAATKSPEPSPSLSPSPGDSAESASPEPSEDPRSSAQRLLVRLKVPRPCLMGLKSPASRLNKPQDLEDECRPARRSGMPSRPLQPLSSVRESVCMPESSPPSAFEEAAFHLSPICEPEMMPSPVEMASTYAVTPIRALSAASTMEDIFRSSSQSVPPIEAITGIPLHTKPAAPIHEMTPPITLPVSSVPVEAHEPGHVAKSPPSTSYVKETTPKAASPPPTAPRATETTPRVASPQRPLTPPVQQDSKAKAKPLFNITYRLIMDPDKPHIFQEWTPEGGLRKMSLIQLTKEVPIDDFCGFRFRLQQTLVRRLCTVMHGKQAHADFEAMKKKFGDTIKGSLNRAEAGEQLDFVLDIEPIETDDSQLEGEEPDW